MECFGLLLEHLAWIEHQFSSGIRDSKKAGSLWGMMWGVGGVKKLIHKSWLAKGFGLGLLYWSFNGVQEDIPALFKSSQWHFHQDNAPVHNSILVTDYLTKMSIKTLLHPPIVQTLLILLRGCSYETNEEMKEAVTKVIYTLTQEDFRGPSKLCWNGTTSALQPEEITSKGSRVWCVYYQ